MSIWVRSQNKEKLVEATNFRIREFLKVGIGTIYNYSIDVDVQGDTFWLGVYSTNEKALKVLDKIQREITSQLCDINRVVFQMPQDDEVEV